MTTTLVLFSIAIVGVSVLGGLLPLATVLTHTRLQGYLSFSAGAMLGAAFFHMMPEAVRMGSAQTLNWAAFGLLALFFLERFFAFHHHEAPADPTEPCPTHAHEHSPGRGHSAGLVDSAAPGGSASGTKGTSLHWGAAAFGLAAHSLAGGVALASASVIAKGQQPSGVGAAAWGVFLATIIHKPADALTIVSLMLRAGAPRMLAHLVNLGFALMIPLGVGIFLLGMDKMEPDSAASATAAALAFSAGTFLCIALSDLLPELQFHEHDRVFLSLALLAGFALMGLTSMWEPSDAHDHAPHPHTAVPVGAAALERG
ncbi:ZIP family metal transporter [Singulisphaera acidiphila]|uniref:Putative divalent heavy-metal cations transporter n=1 Tax=Singulisphaera acidiphila (strain ATCC BAA-1392 / DSM 18658 / VKM B-2454 / MOB10) TaxID=886293 RepID=L0DLF7_SINAD|nr:ZIP family metal transporter [Singulisphaera acidiphila]AGA30077.1 putative divalent heavy-metal cations transporter [Singulisphaera acidiphila DSM 18658]